MTIITNSKGLTYKRVTINIPLEVYETLSRFPNSVSKDAYYCILIGLGIDPNTSYAEIRKSLTLIVSKLDEFEELGMYPTLRDELITVPKEIRRKDEAMAEVYKDLEWLQGVVKRGTLNWSGIGQFKTVVWKRKHVRVTKSEAASFLFARKGDIDGERDNR